MVSDLINTIKKVGLEAIDSQALKVMYGKVTNVDPITVEVGTKLTLPAELISLDSPVEKDEPVIVIKYSSGGQYLVLSTKEKVYQTTTVVGGEVLPTNQYPTDGEWKSLGTFTITYYCCEEYHHICNAGPPYTTATGTKPHVGGCAVDPKVIPLGSYIKMNDVVYHAEDTGGAIKGNRIDIVVPTHAEAL
jgi:3D (Asp-Asp-Asp) domain-containing protein